MPRKTRTITFSLPPELASRLDDMVKRQGSTRSEILRESLLRYLKECEWKELLRYGEQTTKEHGIEPTDVGPLVEQYRAETNPV